MLKVLTIIITLSFPVAAYADRAAIDCLATAIYHEARGESERGQEAVGFVVKNRTKTNGFPKSVCKVVYQIDQFTNIHAAKPNKQSSAWQRAKDIAIRVLTGKTKDPTKGATYFYAQKKVNPQWAKLDTKPIVIGNHTFVRNTQ